MKIDIFRDWAYFGTVNSFKNLLIIHNNLKNFSEVSFKIN